MIILTNESGSGYVVTISRTYPEEEYDLTFGEEQISKTLSSGATSYDLFISNNGRDDSNKWVIDIELG